MEIFSSTEFVGLRRPSEPFGVERQWCGGPDGRDCSIRFTESLDDERFDPTRDVDGEAASWVTETLWGGLRLRLPDDNPRTITLKETLTDVFGRRLQTPTQIELKPGAEETRHGRLRIADTTRSNMLVLDPRGPSRADVDVVGSAFVRAELRAVDPADWLKFPGRPGAATREGPLPGRLVSKKDLPVSTKNGGTVEVPLGSALRSGHAILSVRGDSPGEGQDLWIQRTHLMPWVDLSRKDRGEVTVWVRDFNGHSVAGADVELMDGETIGVTAKTDAEGLATLPFESADAILVRKASDHAILPFRRRMLVEPTERLEWHVVTDRGVYQPGEKILVFGWVRRVAVLGRREVPHGRVDWKSVLGNAQGSAEIDALGRFHFVAEAGEGGLGHQLFFSPGDDSEETQVDDPFAPNSFWTNERVAVFPRPSTDVTLDVDHDVVVAGGTAQVSLTATERGSRASVRGVDVEWTTGARPVDYSARGWPEFSFGESLLGEEPSERDFDAPIQIDEDALRFEAMLRRGASLTTTTDERGRDRLALSLIDAPPRPMKVYVTARVRDRSARSTVTVLPSDYLVGLRVSAEQDTPGRLRFDAIVVDLSGRAVPGIAVALDVAPANRLWSGARTTVVSSDAPVSAELPVGAEEAQEIRAAIVDREGRRNESRVTLRPQYAPRIAPVVSLSTSGGPFSPGDEVTVEIRSSVVSAEAILALDSRERRRSTTRVRIQEPRTTVPLRLDADETTDARVVIDAVTSGGDVARALHHPEIRDTHRLNVTLSALSRVVRAGEELKIDATVMDSEARGVGKACLDVLMVDEAALGWTRHEYSGPWRTFGGSKPLGEVRDLFDHVLPYDRATRSYAREIRRLHELEVESFTRAGDTGCLPARKLVLPLEAVAPRQDPLAAFMPCLETDSLGRATIALHVPREPARWRLVAFATATENRFGEAAMGFSSAR